MKLKIISLVGLALLAAFAWTFVKQPLPVPDEMGPVLPEVVAVEGVSLSLIRSAELAAREGLSVRGGSMMKERATSVVAFVVEHPRGTLSIDAGVGRDAVAHLDATPWIFKALAEMTVLQPTVDALLERGVKLEEVEGVVLTHAHWDHVSGMADLPGVPLWLTPEELAFARSDDIGGELFRRLEAERPFALRKLDFTEVAYGPFESSLDFFDDGSVILVPMTGHTPGSIGVFITDANGKRVLIIGDTSWTKEGVDWPAEKPWLAKRLADSDAAAVREQLVLLHQLQRANPELLIVPAHDKRVHAQITDF